MDLTSPAAFSALLLGCAYYDLKFKKVPDLLTAALWVSLIFLGTSAFTIAGVMFGFLYFMNSVIVALKKRFFLSWADVLGVPPFVAVMVSLSAPPILIITPLILSFLASGLLKEKTPVFPFLAAACAGYIVISVAM